MLKRCSPGQPSVTSLLRAEMFDLHIDSDGGLVVLHRFVLRSVDASILHDRVESIKCPRFLRELLDTLVAAEIQLPHIYRTFASSAGLDIALGRLALIQVSTRDDDFRCVQANVMSCCFLSQSGVGSSDNNGLSRAVRRGVFGSDKELRVEERRHEAEHDLAEGSHSRYQKYSMW